MACQVVLDEDSIIIKSSISSSTTSSILVLLLPLTIFPCSPWLEALRLRVLISGRLCRQAQTGEAVWELPVSCNIGALILRIGFWGPLIIL